MTYDAILILGGGVRAGGELPEFAKRRLDLALARQSGEPMAPLSAGTSHRPAILDADGRLLTESLAGARYLIGRGIPPDRIFCEATAYDTIGNAYFSRVQLTDPLGWRRLLIITSQFHMPRTEAIFRWIYSLDSPLPYQLEFAASANDGLSDAALSGRMEHERTSLRAVEQLRERLTSMRAVASWLFTAHKAYQPVREPLAHDSSDLLDSY
jgi:hypothetical protein